jgi:hypothetical protein
MALPKSALWRFKDLQSRGIVRNWPQLKRLILHEGFPAGRHLSANCRVWTEEELSAWWEARPTAWPPDKEKGASAACNSANPHSDSVDTESNNRSPQDAQPLLKNGGAE